MVTGKKCNSVWFNSAEPQYYTRVFLSFLRLIDFLRTNLIIRLAFAALPFLG